MSEASKPHQEHEPRSVQINLQANGTLDALRQFVEMAKENNWPDDAMARFSVKAMRDLFEHLEARQDALREILRHTGAPNAWREDDGCQLRADGHDNCRPVIFAIARSALSTPDRDPEGEDA